MSQRTVSRLLRKGWDALETEDYDGAESLGRRALLADPDSVEARLLLGNALLGREDYPAAAEVLHGAVERAPDDPEPRTDLAISLFQMCDFRGARTEIESALGLREKFADGHYWMALCLEREGDYRGADREYARAHALDPEEFPLPVRVSPDDFRRILQDAVEHLPEEFQGALKNLSIEVEDLPGEELLRDSDPPMDPSLLGLFEGVPKGRGSLLDSPRLPDRIVLFQRNIERRCQDRDELVEDILVTIRHEVGHYLGLEEDDLERCGYE